jgi:hypothetical protein
MLNEGFFSWWGLFLLAPACASEFVCRLARALVTEPVEAFISC